MTRRGGEIWRILEAAQLIAARGEGRLITEESMKALAKDAQQRGLGPSHRFAPQDELSVHGPRMPV